MDNFITLYQQRLNLANGAFLRIDHDDAIIAIVYKITLPTGMQLILKICTRPSDYLREVFFLKHFAGIIPVPNILDIVQPEMGIDGAILMECLPGTPLTASKLTDALAYEIGSALARIHLNRISGYGDLTQPHDLSPDPRVHFTQKFEEGLVECSNHLPQELLEKSRRYYDQHVDLLTAVDSPCMIHRDFRAGNLMVHDGMLQGVIDWSSGRASFAQEDFCPLEHGEWPTNPVSKKSFFSGYASIRPVPDYRSIMPLLRLNKAFATIGFTVKRDIWQSSAAAVYQFNRRFLEAFFQKRGNAAIR